MSLSEPRISYLAHLVMKEITANRLGKVPNESSFLAETKRVLRDFFGKEDRLDEVVRQRIDSLSRRVPAGSREWDILYRKYWEEEAKRHKG